VFQDVALTVQRAGVAGKYIENKEGVCWVEGIVTPPPQLTHFLHQYPLPNRNYSMGRPKGSKNKGPKLVKLADDAAEMVLQHDMAIIAKPVKTKEDAIARERALERLSRMTKGRLPTRIAVGGDENGEPVPFTYVEVADAQKRDDDGEDSQDSTDTGTTLEVKPKPEPKPKKKRRSKRVIRPVPKVLRGKPGFGAE